MIMIPPPMHPCEGKATSSDADTVSTTESPDSSMEKRLSSCSLSSSDRDRDRDARSPTPATPPPAPRRSIFSSYWQKGQSSSSLRDDGSDGGSPGRDNGGGVANKRTPAWEPSYLGVYSFAPPSPLLSPKPPPALPLSPISSTDSLSASPPAAAGTAPLRPKSILRRHRSRSFSNREVKDEAPQGRVGRPRSNTCVGPELSSRAHFDIAPPPLVQDDISSETSRASSRRGIRDEIRRQHSFVHFDPTITVRECVDEDSPDGYDSGSNWFSENELRTFMAETVNLCHSSAVTAIKTYSLPAVKRQYETAHDAGIKSPVLSTTHPEYRALYADPVLHAADEDAIVHDGSKKFFRIMGKEMRSALIVDSSPSTLKLFRRHVLSMFPHVRVDTASSGEDALDKIQVGDPARPGLNYDLIVVEERLHHEDDDADAEESRLDLTGSELLRLLNEMEDSSSCQCGGAIKPAGCFKPQQRGSSRRSLKIGVSVSLGEDCEALKGKGGADFLWSKPPPKPSNGLRNQVLNALLSKRGKSVFVCGC